MAYYRISDFAQKVGVSTNTLRNWDKEGILKPHHISPTGYRYYSEEQYKKIVSQQVKGKEED